MKKMMFAAVAALAMVGVANAAKSYGIVAEGYVLSYAKYDTDPGDDHGGWYSCYVMKQEDAQKAMGAKEAVTYSDMATWLGENFAANKASVIDNAEMLPFSSFTKKGQYEFIGGGNQGAGGLDAAIGVFFYKDDDNNLAYNVMANDDGSMLYFDDSYSAASGWQAVPEPTSGMLLLLGVAGLALKRKRA